MDMHHRILAECSRVEAFITAEVQKGVDERMLRKAQCASLVCMISSCNALTQPQITAIQAAIDHGEWCNDDKSKLLKALQTKSQQVAGARAMDRTGVKGQDCSQSFELYLTDADWRVIEDPKTPCVTKIATVQTRLKNINCTHANEQTKGRIARIIRYKGVPGGASMTTDEWYDLLKRVAQAIDKLKVTKLPKDAILAYPLDPRDLPEVLFQKAYAKECPAMKDVAELGACTAGLRKSHDSFKKSAATSPQQLSLVQPSHAGTQNFMNALAQYFTGPMLQQAMQAATQHQESAALPGLTVFADNRRASMMPSSGSGPPGPLHSGSGLIADNEPLAAADSLESCGSGLPEPPLAIESGDAPKDLIDLDKDEELLRKALGRPTKKTMSDAVMKRPAMKRPAAASVAKRPACSVPYTKHPPVPTEDVPNPVLYKKAKLYAYADSFRCIKNPSKSLSDKKLVWKSYGGKHEAWKAALQYVDGK